MWRKAVSLRVALRKLTALRHSGEPEGMGSQPDKLIHAIAADNQLRCMAAVSTQLVGEACRRHQTFPTASVALGRTLTGGRCRAPAAKTLEKTMCLFPGNGP